MDLDKGPSFPGPACGGHVYCCLCGLVAGTPLGAPKDASMWTNELRVLFRPWESSGDVGKVSITGKGYFYCGKVKDCCVLRAPVTSGDATTWKTFRCFRSEDSFPLHEACWQILHGLHPDINLERLLIFFRRRERWPSNAGWPRGLDMDFGGVESFWTDVFRGVPPPLAYMLMEPSLEAPPVELPAVEAPDTPMLGPRPIVPEALGTLFTALDSDIVYLILLYLDIPTFDKLPSLSRSVRSFLTTWDGYWRATVRLYWPWMVIQKRDPASIPSDDCFYKQLFRTSITSQRVANTHRMVGVIRDNVDKELGEQ